MSQADEPTQSRQAVGRARENRGLSAQPGASKARFFIEFGFRIEEWERLAEALREHGRTHEVSQTCETGFGPRYIVEGELNTPSGRHPRARTVWQMDKGAVAPRLISAYPLEAKL